MKRSLSLIGVLAVLGLAACSNPSNPTTVPSTLPTAIPSSIAATIDQRVCEIQAQVLTILGQLRATTLQSPADLASQLRNIQAQLNDQANTLASQGSTPLANQVRNVADAIGQLANALTGTDQAALVGAVAAVVGALSQIPGCPSPTPTGSP